MLLSACVGVPARPPRRPPMVRLPLHCLLGRASGLARRTRFREFRWRVPSSLIVILALTMSLAACTSLPGPRSSRGSEMAALRTLKLINYFPSRSSWAYMWEDFHARAIDQDMARMAVMHANAVRIIISTAAFGFPRPHPQDMAELRQVIGLARRHGLRVQLTLFDGFVDWEAIQGSREWARSLLASYAGDREIAFIELRNEIDPASPAQMMWTRDLLPYVETLAQGVPVTVSVTGGAPVIAELRRQLGSVKPDFWDLHYYGVAGGAYATFAAARAIVWPELLYIGEFGFSTWLGNAGLAPGLPYSQQELDAYQAYYYASVEAAAKAAGLPPAAPWTLNDFSRAHTPAQPSPAEYFYGMYRLNGSAKPAAAVISQFFSTDQVNTSFNQDFAQLTDLRDGPLPVLWQLKQSGGGSFAADPAVTYADGGSARLSGTAASCPAYAVTPPNGFVRPGESVSVSVRVQGARATGASGVLIIWLNMSDGLVNPAQTPFPAVAMSDGTTSWANLRISSTAPAGAAYAQIDLVSCANKGTVWFSDVHFSPAPVAAGA